MKSLNTVQLIGKVWVDPEFSDQSGKMVSKLSLATTEEWLDKTTTEKRVSTEWHKLVCFNKLAELVRNYIKKGAQIYITGKLKTSKWQDKSGEARYTTEIVVNELIMLDANS